MKKLYYNFRKDICSCGQIKRASKKFPVKLEKTLDEVKHILSPYIRLDAEASECTVIEHFEDENLFVAYPISALGKVKILVYKYNEDKDMWSGLIHLGDEGTHARSFHIQDNVLYIGKSTYNCDVWE
jgi:hypothetical protein